MTINDGFKLSGTLDLNGSTLTVEGDLIQTGGVLKVNNGTLIVKGDYNITNSSYLEMLEEDDKVIVEGDFLMASHNDHDNYLKAGRLEIKGDFRQKTTHDSYNFLTSGTHRVVLNGSEKQVVAFDHPFGSYFNILEINNTSSEGVEFSSSITITQLFNHHQNPFTLSDEANSYFNDYDEDGVNDNLDPYPADNTQSDLDSDGDGILDSRERELGLNPNSNDSDGDGILDKDEIGDVDNPTDTDGDEIIDALDEDSDNDGISDAQEREAGTNPQETTNPISLELSTAFVKLNQFKEFNLSLVIEHLQNENVDVVVSIEDSSLATLNPSWHYELVAWEMYSEGNLTLTINAQEVGESNISITVTDEQNREFTTELKLIVEEVVITTHEVPLTRDGWNLIGICQTMNREDIDMSGIEEIQAQDGKTLYTGEWANYSNLEILEAGYGYWVKGVSGTSFEVGVATDGLEKPLQRDGWNLMASCEDRSSDILDMSNITEIQAQDGETIYTGAWANYSNLETLLNGYGYWVKGEVGVMFNAK